MKKCAITPIDTWTFTAETDRQAEIVWGGLKESGSCLLDMEPVEREIQGDWKDE
jgi:hypothetical protein